MRMKTRACVLVLLLCCGVCGRPCAAGEEKPKGPHVEITPSDDRAAYSGYLLSFTDGELDVQLENGETRQEKAGAVKSVRFLPAPAEPVPPPARGPPGPKHLGWTDVEEKRLRDLAERDGKPPLTATEGDELTRLRRRKHVENARSAAVFESTRGHLEEYLGTLQQRLKRATTEEEARDLVWRLMFAHAQKGPGVKLKEALQADIEGIANAEVRKHITEESSGILGWFTMAREWRKDKEKDK